MPRDFFVNGPCLVRVKGNVASGFSSLTELGLSEGDVVVTPNSRHRDINVNAWGPEIPADVQFFLADLHVTMTLVHFDRNVLDLVYNESVGGPALAGQMGRAGLRMGNNSARFSPTNHYVGLNLTSPDGGVPWRFFFAYLTGPPYSFPLGTERALVTLNWRVIPFTQDPYNNGLGANNYQLWDFGQDN